MKGTVALVKGKNRYSNILKALNSISQEIDIADAKNIVVKINLTSPRSPLAITHIDAIKAVLDFIQQINSSQVTIAEGTGSAMMSTTKAYEILKYRTILKKYNLQFIDLNTDQFVEAQIYNTQLQPFYIRIAKTVLDSDYLISLSLPKTHNSVVMTASIKNIVMGSLVRSYNVWSFPKLREIARYLVRKLPMAYKDKLTATAAKVENNDKLKMHQGYKAMNLNLYTMAKIIKADLSIVDGFEAMEGNGPINGEKVNWGVALVSTDGVACDRVVAELMGIDVNHIGYLKYCIDNQLGVGNLNELDIIGNSINECKRSFKLHEKFHDQLEWCIEKNALNSR